MSDYHQAYIPEKASTEESAEAEQGFPGYAPQPKSWDSGIANLLFQGKPNPIQTHPDQ